LGFICRTYQKGNLIKLIFLLGIFDLINAGIDLVLLGPSISKENNKKLQQELN
jgi:hypothetical protein